ncbi:hypothetical protein, partial [Pseudomonas sp. UMAB-08]|uniref:hypothetical protein n=1 Tax=Pseudomonas sp. UMAB-08 TaxID=1365375 RepID=UPI001C55E9FA
SAFFEPQTARPLKTAAYFRPSLRLVFERVSWPDAYGYLQLLISLSKPGARGSPLKSVLVPL